MDSTITNVFIKECEKAIAKVSESEIERFVRSTYNRERIELIYPSAKTIPKKICPNGKDFQIAEREKLSGNKSFANKNYEQSISAYNRGIIKCPQNTSKKIPNHFQQASYRISDESRELLSILISNRSAGFFELHQFEKVLADLDYTLSIGSYPERFQYKIWLRKAKSCAALQRKNEAKKALQLAVDSLKSANLNEAEMKKKLEEISFTKKSKAFFSTRILNAKENWTLADSLIETHIEFISAHKHIRIDSDPSLGRYARAGADIGVGVIVVEEEPHCAVVAAENVLTNCQHCCTSTGQPYACPDCAHVIFCSARCADLAKIYHDVECGIQATLLQAGASVNCLMAWRMITQRPLSFFLAQKSMLETYLHDKCSKPPITSSPYTSKDYLCAFFLCRNEERRVMTELVHYTCMAIYLVDLLKQSGYFNEASGADDKCFIACLILHHLEILQFNSHEISEMRKLKKTNEDTALLSDNEEINELIGAGLYPTLALFNHSCDPSIMRYNVGSRMVARTIKPIAAGEIVYENYGPLYSSAEREDRRLELRNRYLFECNCAPCLEHWPIFNNLETDIIRIRCEKCASKFVLHINDAYPCLQCSRCKNVTKIFRNLKGLSALSQVLETAERMYVENKFVESINLFKDALDILYKYSAPPSTDIIKIQNRLQGLYLRLGNKQFKYIDE